MKRLSIILIFVTILSSNIPVNAKNNIVWSIDNKKAITYINDCILVINNNNKTDVINRYDGKSVWGDNKNELKTELDKVFEYYYLNNSQYITYKDYFLLYIDTFKCFDLVTGKLLWSNNLLSDFLEPELFDDKYAYLGFRPKPIKNSMQAQICKLNLETGVYEIIDIRGSSLNNNSIVIPLFINKDRLYFANSLGLVCYLITDKKVEWESKIMLAYPRGLSKKYSLTENTLIVISADYDANIDNYYIVVLDISNGSELWRRKVHNYILKNDYLICLTQEDNTYYLRYYLTFTGVLIKTIELKDYSYSFFDSNMQLSNNQIYLLSGQRTLGILVIDALFCDISNIISYRNCDVTSFNVNDKSICLSLTEKDSKKTKLNKVLSISTKENKSLIKIILDIILMIVIP